MSVMASNRMKRVNAVLKSALAVNKISSLSFDPSDGSATFKFDGKFHELIYDSEEGEYEMVRYNNRKSFDRLGLYDGDRLTEFIYTRNKEEEQK